MDNIMDKLAQKLNAQEMIKANSEAETNEMKKLKLQISEYEKILQEMRKLNYKNTEISEKLDLLIGDNVDKIQNIKEDEHNFLGLLRDITDEQTRNMESDNEQRTLDRQEREQQRAKNEQDEQRKKEQDEEMLKNLTELLEGKFQASDEYNHKENVKVYRNVQAVVVDELKRYGETTKEEHNALQKRVSAATWIGSIAAVASICNIVIWVVAILIYSGVIK
jgi:hypothetical protein